jgi:molybdopterin-guanine dinucleotide biosynthesis protein A
VSRTGIVLAGGRSRRFGSNKLAAPLGQGTILEGAIAAVASVVDGVIVAGGALPEGFVAGDVPVALVRDPDPDGGPLVALEHVLASAKTDPTAMAIICGGDMPRLVPAVLRLLLETLGSDKRLDAVYLGTPEAPIASQRTDPPRRQVLPLALRVQPAARAARAAVEAGDRSLQALLDRMATMELAPSAWVALDPDGSTLIDVDTRADLDRLRGS